MPFNVLNSLLTRNPTVEEVQALIDENPNLVKAKNDVGNLSLHIATGWDAPKEVVHLLVKAYPDAVREKNQFGVLPLHNAVAASVHNAATMSVEVIQLLIKEYPDAVKEKNNDGELPLHYAFNYRFDDIVNTEVVLLLIKEHPDTAKEKDKKGWLPLHRALSFKETEEVVQLLIREHPAAAREKYPNGDLPLHIAVNKEASAEVIRQLIKEYPDALNEKDVEGLLPLHRALVVGSEEVKQLLIKEYPDAVREKYPNGDLPLHVAVNKKASAEVIRELIKIYPDAAKEKDENGNLPLDPREVEKIYDTIVHKITRSKSLFGDHAKGKDLLGVEEEAHAIADTIAFTDLQTPFVVGILGGWGSGKSFTFNLIKERLKEIQNFDLTNEVLKLDFPYVGHIYPIMFDVWTYSKGCVWAGMMDRILTVLNDQLDLEAAIEPELLMKGVNVIEIMEILNTFGKMKYMKEAVQDVSVQQTLREWKPKGGNITKALIKATNSNYKMEVKELAKKKQKLHYFLALEDVTAKRNTKILPEIKKLIKDAYTQYTEENPDDPVPQTVDGAMNSFKQWKGMLGLFKRYMDLFRAGSLSPLWIAVFLSSLIIAVVFTPILEKIGTAPIVIGPFLSGIFAKFNDARVKLNSAQEEIARLASEMNLDKEHVQKALEAANGAQLCSDTNDVEKQQDAIRDLNADINSLEDRVWLREGDSLKKVVGDRVRSSNYEEQLGVVHQAQADLQRISDAMLRRDDDENDAANKIFPRGDPRIVLFIDDLDRCPPKKVVETLEAVQLLVKTKLFVVVLAIDAQYVTLCLEKEYEGILSPERRPSGLDYIEKIIQLPYRVPPVGVDYIENFLQAQMMAEDDEEEDVSDFFASNISQTDQEEGSQEKMIADKQDDKVAHEFSACDEVRVEKEEPSVEVSVESKCQRPHNVVNLSLEKPNAKTPFLREKNKASGYGTLNTTNEAAPKERPTKETSMIGNAANNVDVSVNTPMNETAKSETKESLVAIPTKEIKFTWNEVQLLKEACVLAGVGPRSGRRLVNVFKLMKIIWYRRDQTPGVEACVLILALCASSSKKVRQAMCKVFAKIEQTTSIPSDCSNLRDFIEQTLEGAALTKMDSEKCKGIFEKVKWEDDGEWILVKNDLRLLRSFSFVGEYNE